MRLAWRVVHGLVSASLLIVCGCATGAMRIDVEVYKGPLAQTSETQLASLVGYLEEAERALVENMNFTLAIVANANFERLGGEKGNCYFQAVDAQEFFRPQVSTTEDQVAACSQQNGTNSTQTSSLPQAKNSSPSKGGNSADTLPKLHLYFPLPAGSQPKKHTINDPISWCDRMDPEGVYDQIAYLDCTILRSVFSDSRDMLREVNNLLSVHVKEVHDQKWDISDFRSRNLLMEVAETASKFRAKAFRWAVASAAGQSNNCKTRVALANFVMTASEFGNQLQTRSDAMFKQLGLQSGRDARELALSTHLQETEPTDFVHLYDWLEASADGCPGDWFRRNLMPGYPGISVEDRVKIVERLYGDHFWSKINTVHASGVGKVSMAFVKDGIGNWNLKNFSSQPGELLDAYLNVAKKALEAAAKVAAATSGVGSGGAAITAALKYADQSIAGPTTVGASTQVAVELQSLEADLQKTLKQQIAESAEKEKSLRDKPDELKKHRSATIAQYQKTLATFRNKVDVLNMVLHPDSNGKAAEEAVRKVLKTEE